MTRNSFFRSNLFISSVIAMASLSACSGQVNPPSDGSGGAFGSGGESSSGGAATGGAPAGGASSGGAASGGAASGGAASGGAASGGDMGAGGSWRDEDWNAVTNGPTFQFVRKIAAFWNPSCVGADCHGGTPAHISLIPDDGFYERLTTATSDDVCLDANGMPQKLIVPGEPENSAFLRILKGPCDNMGRMPGGECIDGGDCLPPDLIAYLEQWIAEGAQNN